jgi:hypothetical protein
LKLQTFNRFLNLSTDEQVFLLRAVLLVGLVRLGLWLLPLRTLQHALGSLFKREKTPGKQQLPVERISWAVQVAGSIVPRSTCLVQALAVQALLASGGQASTLCIGVAKDADSSIEAHAWVEMDGQVIIGATEPGRYTRLMTVPGEPE